MTRRTVLIFHILGYVEKILNSKVLLNNIVCHLYVTLQKLFAFVVGGIFCGIAGALLVSLEGHVGTESHDFSKSLILICMVILGGMDNTVGVLVGAFILTVITEKLRVVADYQQLVYGAVLVVMLIARPNGIIPKRVRDYCTITGRLPKISLNDAKETPAE